MNFYTRLTILGSCTVALGFALIVLAIPANDWVIFGLASATIVLGLILLVTMLIGRWRHPIPGDAVQKTSSREVFRTYFERAKQSRSRTRLAGLLLAWLISTAIGFVAALLRGEWAFRDCVRRASRRNPCWSVRSGNGKGLDRNAISADPRSPYLLSIGQSVRDTTRRTVLRGPTCGEFIMAGPDGSVGDEFVPERHAFSAVDDAPDPALLIAGMDAADGYVAVERSCMDQRRSSNSARAIGCSMSAVAQARPQSALADFVGTTGSVRGIDASTLMIAEAMRRSRVATTSPSKSETRGPFLR